MRKITIIILTIGILLSSVVLCNAETNFQDLEYAKNRISNAVVLLLDHPKAYINNKQVSIDALKPGLAPYAKESRTLVPIRFISESIGAEVNWDQNTKMATILYNDKVIKLILNDKKLTIGDKVIPLDVPAEAQSERIFVPLRAINEALGKKVFYHNKLMVISDQDSLFDIPKEAHLVQSIINAYSSLESIQKTAPAAPEYAVANTLGNTALNILNGGTAAKQGSYVYFANPYKHINILYF